MWSGTGIIVCTCTAADTMGTAFLHSSFAKSQLTCDQVDCGISIHKQFGFYLPGADIRMPWSQRVIGIVQILKEYTSVPRLVAIILLPIAVFASQSEDMATKGSTNQQDRSWLRLLFLSAYLSQKINTHILYSHVGLRALSNMQSNRIWGALRKIIMPDSY